MLRYYSIGTSGKVYIYRTTAKKVRFRLCENILQADVMWTLSGSRFTRIRCFRRQYYSFPFLWARKNTRGQLCTRAGWEVGIISERTCQCGAVMRASAHSTHHTKYHWTNRHTVRVMPSEHGYRRHTSLNHHTHIRIRMSVWWLLMIRRDCYAKTCTPRRLSLLLIKFQKYKHLYGPIKDVRLHFYY